MPSDINELKHQPSLDVDVGIAISMHRDPLAGDMILRNIHNWLSPPDSRKNFDIACESRHRNTGAWFVHGSTLSEWKASGPSSLLWINGKR